MSFLVTTLSYSVSAFFIFVGAIILLVALSKASRIMTLLNMHENRMSWHILRFLMAVFCIGYLLSIVLLIYDDVISMDLASILPIVMGLVFLLGACFVLLVVIVSLKTIAELINSIEKVKTQNTKLEKSEKGYLELNQSLTKKNEELEDFNYIASHDLQEPLRTIGSFINLLELEYKNEIGVQGQEYMKFITESAQRMRKLISALLEYSRAGKQVEFERVNLNDLLHEGTLRDLKSSIENAKATIEVDQLPVITAPRIELNQLFQNLIGNALKFKSPIRACKINIGYESKDDNIIFHVKDNGIGISKAQYKNVFMIFKRLHNKTEYEGTGIGLAYCKKTVDIWSGDLWVESEEGQGSTFLFSIPKKVYEA